MTSKHTRVLVTGGAGFIGSHLVDALLNRGFEVTVVDNLNTGRLENITRHQDNDNFHFVKGDIRDLHLVKDTLKDKDAVFHEAALASVQLSVENPLVTNDVNVTGTLNLLKVSSDLHVQRFVYASSAAIYGDTSAPQKREDMTPRPTSPYGVSKLVAENYVQLFHKVYGLNTTSLRYFNVYGPRQRFDMHASYGGVITIFLNRLLRNKPPIIYGDGEQTRDFVYVEDIIQANILAFNNRSTSGEIFNIATGTKVSINQVAGTLQEILDKKNVEPVHSNPRVTDIRHGYADISKAQRILGFHPTVPLKQGLIKLVNWYKEKKLDLSTQ